MFPHSFFVASFFVASFFPPAATSAGGMMSLLGCGQ